MFPLFAFLAVNWNITEVDKNSVLVRFVGPKSNVADVMIGHTLNFWQDQCFLGGGVNFTEHTPTGVRIFLY